MVAVAAVYLPPPPLPPLPVVEAAGRPRTAVGWLARGQRLTTQGQLEAASAAYEAALRLRRDGTLGPLLAPAYFRMAFSYLARKQYGMAYAPLDAGLQLDPAFQPAWTELGRCYYLLRRYDRAERACRRAVALRPDDAAAWLLGGLAAARSPTPTTALPLLAMATTLDPSCSLAPKLAGELQIAANNPVAAEVELRLAWRRQPGDPKVHALLVEALRLQGRPLAALACKWGNP